MIKWLLILCLMFLSPGALAQGDALEQPVVTLPEYARVGEPFTVSWTKVEGAAFYSIRFENGDDVFFAADTEENFFTYHDMRLKAGAYQITVGVFPAGSARGSESLPMPLRALSGRTALAALGAVIFVLSDMGVCHGMLYRIPKKLDFVYLGIYYLAQLLLAISAF